MARDLFDKTSVKKYRNIGVITPTEGAGRARLMTALTHMHENMLEYSDIDYLPDEDIHIPLIMPPTRECADSIRGITRVLYEVYSSAETLFSLLPLELLVKIIAHTKGPCPHGGIYDLPLSSSLGIKNTCNLTLSEAEHIATYGFTHP